MQNKNIFRSLSFLFTLNLLLVVLTFYNSFHRMASFQGSYSVWVIVHAVCLSIWTIILFLQPLLIYFNRRHWHKWIGLSSIVIVILIVASTLVTSFELFKKLPASFATGKKYSILFSQIYALLIFSILYTMSLLYSRKLTVHIQCMVASLIVILGPVIFRATNNFRLTVFGSTELTCNILTYGILNLVLLLLCSIQIKNNSSFSPYKYTILALIPIEISQIWFSWS